MLEAMESSVNGRLSQLQSCGESSEEELSMLPHHTKVVVTGNNHTKSMLVGLQGVVKKAVGLGGWHWLVIAYSVNRPCLAFSDELLLLLRCNALLCQGSRMSAAFALSSPFLSIHRLCPELVKLLHRPSSSGVHQLCLAAPRHRRAAPPPPASSSSEPGGAPPLPAAQQQVSAPGCAAPPPAE